MKNFFRFFISRTFLYNLLGMVVVTALVIYVTTTSIASYTNHGEEFSLSDFSGMTIPEVEKLCQEKKLRFEVMDSVFSRRKKRGTVVEQDPPAGFKVKENRRIFLIVNATQPEMIKMPYVKGVDFRQAWMDLESNGLEVEKISYTDDPARHVVVEQKHNGQVIFSGERIEKGSGIELVLGRGYEDDNSFTRIPSLHHSNLQALQKKLFKSFLNVGAVTFDRTIETYEDSLRAFVWKQRPIASSEARHSFGEAVNVWLTIDSAKLEDPADLIQSSDTLDLDNFKIDLSDTLLLEN